MSKKVATEDLYIGGVKAHAAGDELHADDERIERFGWGDKLAGPKTKAAEAAMEAPSTGAVPVTNPDAKKK